MPWLGTYFWLTVIVALGSHSGAEWVRERHAQASTRPFWWAVAAGVLWPIVLAGLAELGVIAGAGRMLRFRGLALSRWFRGPS